MVDDRLAERGAERGGEGASERFHELLLVQLRMHDDSLTKVDAKQDANMAETRQSFAALTQTVNQTFSALVERVGKLETRLDGWERQNERSSGDARHWVALIFSVLSVLFTLFKDFLMPHQH